MPIEKSISYQIESQFPFIYRENGRELIEIVKSYYEFLETVENQSTYNSRRMFEYRDIDTTLERMLLFFKKKYLADLPFTQENIRFVTKKIIDLYRSRGSETGLKLFFRMFYDQDIKVYYPGEDILKPSTSEWKIGRYLQLFPNIDVFSLRGIIGKKIIGSITKSEAVVDKINFFLLNNTVTPVLFLDKITGQFSAFDDILSLVDGQLLSFGRVNGSLDKITINIGDPLAKTGYAVGDILDCACQIGSGAKVIVTSVTENFTGEIVYDVTDQGFGYSEENTLLLVSNQTLFINNTARIFNVLETLEDQFGNRGEVIGQNDIIVGLKMRDADEFTSASVIQTVDRGANNFIVPITGVIGRNDSSPGLLYPEALAANTSLIDLETSVIAVLEDRQTISIIGDVIENFLSVALDSPDFNDSPALIPMSGTANPVTINTTLDTAFDITPFDIGRLVGFDNINPGADYTNQVFALAIDPVILASSKSDQIITLQTINSSFAIGEIVSQGSVNGIIRNIIDNTIIITPYSYFGFSANMPLTYRNVQYQILAISKDYSSRKFGYNAVVDTFTDFAVGKVREVEVINSGFGYIDGSRIRLRDSNQEIAAVGTVSAKGQGISEGFWKTFDSHLNIFDNKKLQDSLFYQDYSYEITSEVDINTYEPILRDVAHLAGTKIFGKFGINREVDTSSNIRIQIGL
jgi:hypothetical protein